MITVDQLSFAYKPERKVLNNISFDLGKGETLGVVGASGCGKSTLLKLLAGLLPFGTDVLPNGPIVIEDLTPIDFRNTGRLSYMFQEASLLPHLSVRENIAFPLSIHGRTDSQLITNLIDIVGLADFVDFLSHDLSGGMKTRVSLARSFITKPSLLLLDEPFSALDIAWKSRLYNELELLKASNDITVVLVTHDVQEALLLSDKIVVLNSKGEVQLKMDVKTDCPIKSRIENIPAFMDSIYSEYATPLQNAIINGNEMNYA